MSHRSYIKYFKILKSDENLRARQIFSWKLSPEVGYVIQITKSTSCILAVDQRSS